MIYPRVKLTRTLLKDDGVVFISIDDNEVGNLMKVCDEVFGSDNFLSKICWARKRGKDNSAKFFSRNHEFILVYAKSYSNCITGRLGIPDKTRKAYKNRDNDERGDYREQGIWARGTQGGSEFSFTSKTGQYFASRLWLVGESTMNSLDKDDRLRFIGDKVYKKLFISEYKGDIPETIWDDASNAANAADEIKNIFGNQLFDTVKPIPLLEKIVKIGSTEDDVVLDFFSGSATTAHAVMQLNAEDGGRRRHIMVQLPEACDEKSVAFKAGYATIAEIGKERIRRAGAKIRAELEAQLEGELPETDKHQEITAKLANLDTGFRVLKVDSSNMADVYYRPDEVTQDGLALQVENIKPDRSPEDLLFQVLLDWGVDLALPIEQETIAGKTVFFVDGNALAACFDTGLDEDFVKELAKREPLRAVFRDASFATDATKINIEQIFKALSPHTELKAI
jgi:adenine-specific DNA-methyltransferase